MKKLTNLIISLVLLNFSGISLAQDVIVGNKEALNSNFLGQEILIQSKILNEDVMVLVKLPYSYNFCDRSYPVIYALDAQWTYNLYASSITYLAENSASDIIIPEMILVGIVNNDRNKDFTPTKCENYKGMKFPTSGKAENFLRFLKEELAPIIEERFRTVNHRVVSGWSFGGLFTYYSLLNNHDFFKGFLAISPSVWWEEESLLKESINDKFTSHTKLVLTIGEKEEGGWNYNAAENLAKKAQSDSVNNLDFTYLKIEDTGHNQSLPIAVYRGLRAMYSDWLVPDSISKKGIPEVEAYYKNLSTKYGYKVHSPVSIYTKLASNLRSDQKLEEAIALLQEGINIYPENSFLRYYLSSYYYVNENYQKALNVCKQAREKELQKIFPDLVLLQYFDGLETKIKQKIK